MRSYALINFGSHIRFAEKAAGSSAGTKVYTIPRAIPKICDPYILWKFVPHEKVGVHSLEVQDVSGETWFQVRSPRVPLDTMLNCHYSLAKYMS